LVAEQDLHKVVQLVTDAGRELSGAEFGAFFYNVINATGEAYMLYTVSGVQAEAFSKFPMPRNTEVFGPTFRGEGVVRLDDVTKDPRYGKNSPYQGMPPGHLPVRSYLAVPVVSRSGEVLGGLFYGHSRPGAFTADIEDVEVALAAQAAVAIDNVRLNDALRREVETHRQAREASQRLAAIVESSDDAIISKSLDGTIRTWNEAAERLFGYSAKEAIGQPVTMLFPPDHINEEVEIISRIKRGEQVEHYETVRRRKDGSLIDLSLTISPVRDDQGQVVGASKIARDISQRKRDEEALAKATAELARSRDELEFRVLERTASLQEAIGQMEEFSYAISHDIRAPLRAMGVRCGVLLEDYRHVLENEPEALECVHKISENCVRLDKMIRDVLAFGRVARDEVVFTSVSLDELVTGTISLYPSLQEPLAEISVEPLGMVKGHEPSLTQVVSNLLSNATKFVAEGTKPKVKIWSETSGNNLRMWVEDNGIGIEPAYQSRLFNMFERIHPDLPYEGTGVGLAIVKKAIERMNGKVGAISDGKSGSKFWIELPRVGEG
jgi:PAS domain S-box-containing protein